MSSFPTSSTFREKQDSAHATESGRGSIVTNVRTLRAKTMKDARLEVRLPSGLKKEVYDKAKAEKKTVAELIIQALRDYVAGSFRVKRQRFGHGARRMQAAELRQRQVMIINILSDLLNVASGEAEGALKTAACEALMKSCVIQNRQLLALLNAA